MQLVIAILAVVLGALFAFGGWRFFLILLPFWGLFVGFNLGTEAMRALIGDGTFATLTSWAIGLVLALVFAIFSYLYYYAAIARPRGHGRVHHRLRPVGPHRQRRRAHRVHPGHRPGRGVRDRDAHAERAQVPASSRSPRSAAPRWSSVAWFILTGQIPTDNVTWFAIGNEIAGSFIWLVVWLGIAVVGFIAQMATGTFGPDSYELDRESYRYGCLIQG